MRNIPDSHLALSVLISLGSSSGSGFLYRTEELIYLVTAKHVLFNDESNLRSKEVEIVCQTSDPDDESVYRFRIDLEKASPKYHKLTDVSIVKIGEIKGKGEKGVQFTNSPGVENLENGKSNPVTASIRIIKMLNEVIISNDVYVSGYPTSLGIETSKQFNYNKPLLRKGIVANVHSLAQTIILDCPVYGGNSGGPVIQVVQEDGLKEFYLIGVVSQFIPHVQKWKNDRDRITHLEYLNSGYSVATSFDSVLELIEENI